MSNYELDDVIDTASQINTLISQSYISNIEAANCDNRKDVKYAIQELEKVFVEIDKARRYLKAQYLASAPKKTANVKKSQALKKKLNIIEKDIVDAQLELSLLKIVEDNELLEKQEEIQTYYAERLSEQINP